MVSGASVFLLILLFGRRRLGSLGALHWGAEGMSTLGGGSPLPHTLLQTLEERPGPTPLLFL